MKRYTFYKTTDKSIMNQLIIQDKNILKGLKTTLLCCFVLLTSLSFAQEAFDPTDSGTAEISQPSSSNSSDSNSTKPFQMALIYPMSTEGRTSYKYSYRASINLVSGVTGGIDGFEWAGFTNYTKGDLRGFQSAGFMNVVTGDAIGTQMAGFSNIQKGSFKGIQASGFTNTTVEDFKGGQFAGFINYTGGKFKGLQAAGFVNIAKDTASGIQCAGFVNVAAKDMKGAQLAGFGNFARGYQTGTQVAGFINVATDSVVNGQLSGFINVAKDVKGTQLGFINICDSIKGVPVGFLSIVKKGGYRVIEIEANESLYGNINAKIGVSKLYNIFSVGIRPTKDQMIWSYGYGLGTQLVQKNNLAFNLDFTSNQINEGEWFTNRLNVLNKIKLNVSYTGNSGVTFYGGPSINVFVRDTRDQSGNTIPDPKLATFNLYNWAKNNVETQFYPGLSLGARF